jgi:lipoprotein Spr
MKLHITIIVLLLPFLISAQTKQAKHKSKRVQKQSIEQFYTSYKLIPDSAHNPYLYYQIYDWIGTRYKYSGKTKKGIDCSAFVNELYKNVYCIDLSGSSSDLWSLVKPVEKTDLQEGDILFFKIKKGRISHVGLYLGNNKFAHASVHSGVIISDLDEAYYKKYFYKGGRVIQ